MKITIDTDVLARYKLHLDHFLVLLLGYVGYNYNRACRELKEKGLAEPELIPTTGTVIESDNTKDFVVNLIVEMNPKLNNSPIKDFESLAKRLMYLYPMGNKEGTTYPWRGNLNDIVYKLRVLVVQHDFIYTEEEAIQATKQYVDSFKDDRTHMKLLKYFLLRTKDKDISSDFMTIIENNRDENNNR